MLTYLLDTNIVIYILKRRPMSVLAKFNQHADQLAISMITYAELLHGIAKSSSPTKNKLAVEEFVSHLRIVDYDKKAAAHYGHIRACLEKYGNLIGVNDIHIAAQARSAGMVMVTNNMNEFKRVDGLLTENWVGPSLTAL